MSVPSLEMSIKKKGKRQGREKEKKRERRGSKRETQEAPFYTGRENSGRQSFATNGCGITFPPRGIDQLQKRSSVNLCGLEGQ